MTDPVSQVEFRRTRGELLGAVVTVRQPFEAALTAEARQVVADRDPRGARVEVDMQLRLAVNRAVHAAERDVQAVGISRGLAEEGAPAMAAERAASMLGGSGNGRGSLYRAALRTGSVGTANQVT